MKRLDVKENPVLNRKEARYLFEGGAGKMTRSDVTKLVAGDLGVKEDSVIPLSLRNTHGTVDQVATFYIYDDAKEARSQLSAYVFDRNLGKEERKKLIEEKRKKKTPKVAGQKKA